MADDVDLATEDQMQLQERRIEEIRRSSEMPRNTGRCRNCSETLVVGSFCDTDCQTDFEKRRRMRGYAGGY